MLMLHLALMGGDGSLFGGFRLGWFGGWGCD